MDQPQQPVSNATPPTPSTNEQQASQEQNLPYKTGDGSYNRESGKKTLAFVGVIIALIAVLSISSLLMSNKKSSVMIQSQTQQTTPVTTRAPISPTVVPAQSAEEEELDTIELESSDSDMQSIEQDVNQL